MATDWDRVPDEPDLKRDLGYEMADLTVVRSPTESHVVVLPEDQDRLEDEAFIVADVDSLRRLEP